MFRINRLIEDDESIIFKVEKKISPLVFSLIFSPLWMLMALIFIVPCFNNWFMGTLSFRSEDEYTMSIFMMGAFVPLAIILPTSYFINDLKITDKKVFVRKAISGRLVVMSFEDIRAFQCLKVTSRGINFYYIRFFLKNGKKIKSGNLYIKPNSLYNLCNILYSKVGMEVNTRKEIKGLKQDNECSCNVSVFRNFILPVLCLGPFIILVYITIE